MKHVFHIKHWIGSLLLLALLSGAAGSSLVHAAPQSLPAQVADSRQFLPLLRSGVAPLCRFGVNGTIGSYPVQPLRIGWYLDYQATQTPNPPGDIEYYPMIRLERSGDSYNYSIYLNRASTTDAELGAVIAAHPGVYWFIGNEPDRLQYQDDLEPQVYAEAYHDLYQRIKGQDPTAQIVAGTIVQPTPVRLQYLNQVLLAYHKQYGERMPVDVWAFHNFILNEASCTHYATVYPDRPDLVDSICWGADIPPGIDDVTDGLRIDVQDNDDIELFKQQVVAFRTWLAERGYRDTPVFLSEFGVLMPEGLFSPDFDAERVNRFMDESFDFLLSATDPEIGLPADGNRLVQRFAWYSVNDKINHNGYLFDLDKPVAASRTAFGDNFADYTNAIPEEVDLYPMRVGMTGSPPLASRGPTTITLEAVIANSGNLLTPNQASVQFYQGNPAAGGEPIGDPVTVALAGCGAQQTVTLEWPDVAPGSYTVYAVVDGDGAVPETDEDNNTMSGRIHFAARRLQIPLVLSPLNIP